MYFLDAKIEALKKSPIGDIVRLVKVTNSFFSGTIAGLWEFRRKGVISHNNWKKLLAAHCATNGRLTSTLGPVLRVLRPPRRPKPVTGLLGYFGLEDQHKIVAELRRNGVYVFPSLMPADLCNEIESFAREAVAFTEFDHPQTEQLKRYDPRNPLSRLYKIRESDTIRNAAIQRLIADEALAAIAELYLDTQPSIGGADVWWSARYGNEPGSDAAQLFHFDFDAPPAWLKLFVYVTDVGPGNGPHVYVKGTHRSGIASAKALRARGYQRISDSEVEEAFGRDALMEVTGPRGTTFIADTRGFHKGMMPISGDRLLAQVIYCSTFFNEHGIKASMPAKIDPALATTMRHSPRLYERFLK
jgi:hypothetical protein